MKEIYCKHVYDRNAGELWQQNRNSHSFDAFFGGARLPPPGTVGWSSNGAKCLSPLKECPLDPEGGEMPFLTFETRSRFCFLQSRASRRDRDFFTKSQGSRRDRDFCSLNLRLRDEIEIFCHLISKFETRSRFFNEIFPPMWYSKLHLFIYNKYIFLNKKISKICISCWQ